MVSDFVKFLRADNQVNAGQFVENGGAPALRHAAKEADDLVLVAFLAARPSLHFADRLLFGHVTYGTGVEQHDISSFLAINQIVTAAGQIARNLFGIADIHLAAVGFDKDGGHERITLQEA